MLRTLVDEQVAEETINSSIIVSDDNIFEIETTIKFAHDKAEMFYCQPEEAEICKLVKQTFSTILSTSDTGKNIKGDMRGTAY